MDFAIKNIYGRFLMFGKKKKYIYRTIIYVLLSTFFLASL